MDFGLQLRRPRGSNEMGVGRLGVVLGHLGTKMAPRTLQEGLGTDFGRFLYRFCSIWAIILVDLLRVPKIIDFWMSLLGIKKSPKIDPRINFEALCRERLIVGARPWSPGAAFSCAVSIF